MHLPINESALRRGLGTRARWRLGGRVLAVGAVLASLIGMTGVAVAAPPPAGSADLGPNVLVFDPSMPTAQIQAAVDAVANQQVSSEFGTQRYALLFKPGTYGSVAEPLIFQVGYYTEVAGLGSSPTDVTINGHIDVYNQCLAADNCIALTNFWRSMSNLTINVTGESGCRSSADFWAVSQAAPMRRVNITGGNLSLMDYCTAGPQFASGGFIADSAFSGGTVINGSQQQFLVRNSNLDGWTNAVWNQVFAGTIGAPAQSFPNPPYTTLDTNPASRERPFLYVDASGNYQVFVPAAQHDSAGTTWQNGPTAGRSIPLSDFFVASPSDSVQRINSALAQGKNLLFTPGVYSVDRTIDVKRPDTVVLGLGLATLEPQNGVIPMAVADVKGVDIAGLIFDAGPVNSPVLLQVGTRRAANGDARERNGWSDPNDPSAIQDVFFRIGGAHVGKATVSLEVNSDNVILDDIWAWRADHGTGVGWTSNTADTGLVVNGDDVTATGLFVEHFQKTEVIWNGQGGKDIFFQNELPYDVPDQSVWNVSSTQLGYPSFVVSPNVQTFNGYGMGSYVVFIQTPATIFDDMAFQAPQRPGVTFNDVFTIWIAGSGGYNSVINGVGGPDTSTNPGTVTPVAVVSYP